MNALRLFLAVPIVAAPATRQILTQLTMAGGGLRPVSPHQMHLTVKFLGDTDVALVPEIETALRKTVETRAPFELHFRGLGAFPSPQRPEILWLGIEESAELAGIAAELDRRLEPLGFAKEKRAFHPHLTLLRMRKRPPEKVFEMLQQHAATEFQTMLVDHVTLYQSDYPRATVYTPLCEARLEGE